MFLDGLVVPVAGYWWPDNFLIGSPNRLSPCAAPKTIHEKCRLATGTNHRPPDGHASWFNRIVPDANKKKSHTFFAASPIAALPRVTLGG
jgi:hypothetical protein